MLSILQTPVPAQPHSLEKWPERITHAKVDGAEDQLYVCVDNVLQWRTATVNKDRTGIILSDTGEEFLFP